MIPLVSVKFRSSSGTVVVARPDRSQGENVMTPTVHIVEPRIAKTAVVSTQFAWVRQVLFLWLGWELLQTGRAGSSLVTSPGRSGFRTTPSAVSPAPTTTAVSDPAPSFATGSTKRSASTIPWPGSPRKPSRLGVSRTVTWPETTTAGNDRGARRWTVTARQPNTVELDQPGQVLGRPSRWPIGTVRGNPLDLASDWKA